MTYRISAIAEEDLGDIHDYIFRGSPRHATQMLLRIEGIFVLLTDSPKAGTERDELQPGVRSYPVGNYIIFYHLEDQYVVVDRVLHTSRDVDSIMSPN